MQANSNLGVVAKINGHVIVKSGGVEHELKVGDIISQKDKIIPDEHSEVKIIMNNGKIANFSGENPYNGDYVINPNEKQVLPESIQHAVINGLNPDDISHAILSGTSLDDVLPRESHPGPYSVEWGHLGLIESGFPTGPIGSGFGPQEQVFNSEFPIAHSAVISPASPPSLPVETDLTIQKTVSNATPFDETQVTYTINVTNSGPDAAQNVIETDVLPVGEIYVPGSASGGNTFSFNSATNTLTWNLGSVPVGETITETYKVIVEDPSVAPLTNTATVTTSTENINLNHSSSVTINPVPDSDLTVVKTVSNANPLDESQITYTITVTNHGPDTAQNVSLTDVLPAGLSFDSASNGGVDNSGTLSWNLGSLTSGTTDTVTFTATVTDHNINIPIITNTAVASTTTHDENPNPEGSVSINPLPESDVTIFKSDTSNHIGIPGTSETFTIKITNSGADDAPNTVVTDLIPPDFTVDVAATNAANAALGVTVSISGDVATFSSMDVLSGTSQTLDLIGIIAASDTNSIMTNTANVSVPQADGNVASPQDETSSDTLNLYPEASLTITKTDNVSSITAGNTDTYTITVTNTGPSDATNVQVVDALPLQGFTNISSPDLPAGVTFNASTDTWNVGTLASGASVTLELEGTVPSGATGNQYINKATASASDASSVSATDTDTLNHQANLAITKSDGVSSVTAGGADTYTITVTNTGPSDATNVQVVDSLPSQGFTNISSPDLPAGVTFNASTDTWNVGTLASGASVTLELEGTVPSGATGNQYINTATASASDASSVSATDTDTLNHQANLTITKSDGVSSVAGGNADTYTIVVTNNGPSDATNVQVVDTLPSQGFTNISSPDLPAGVTFDASTDTWNVGTLASGASVTLELEGTVPAGVTGSTYVNTATASASDASSVSATDTDNILQPLTIVKTVTSVNGDTIDYDIAITNPNSEAITNVVVTDPLTGLKETIPSIAGNTTDNIAQTYTVTANDIATGGLATSLSALAIPTEATINGSNPSPGNLSYWGMTIDDPSNNGVIPNAVYQDYCIDTSDDQTPGQSYTATIYSSELTSSEFATLDTYSAFNSQANLPAGGLTQAILQTELNEINYIINEISVGTTYTYSDVQKAIWDITGQNPNETAGLGTFDPNAVTQIIDMAEANSNFTPTVGQNIAVIVVPDVTNGSQPQITIAEVPLQSAIVNIATVNGISSSVSTPISGPVANNGTVNSNAGTESNVFFALDQTGSMAQNAGLYEPKIDFAIQSLQNLAISISELGPAAFLGMSFNTTTDVLTPNGYGSLAQLMTALSQISAEGTTNYTQAILKAESIINDAGKLTGGSGISVVNNFDFLTDGGPNAGGTFNPNLSQYNGDEKTWQATLSNNNFTSYAFALGVSLNQNASVSQGAYNDTIGNELNPIATNTAGNDSTNTNPVDVYGISNLSQLPSTLSNTVTTISGHNLLTDTGSNFGSAGAGFIHSISIGDGATFTFNGSTVTETGAQLGGGTNFFASDILTINDSSTLGILSINMETGAYTYTAPSTNPGTSDVLALPISFTLENSVGNTASGTLSLDVDYISQGTVSGSAPNEILTGLTDGKSHVLTVGTSTNFSTIVDNNSGQDTLVAGNNNNFTLNVANSTGNDLLIAGPGNHDVLTGSTHSGVADTFEFTRANDGNLSMTINNFQANSSVLNLSDLITGEVSSGNAGQVLTSASQLNGELSISISGGNTVLSITALTPSNNSSTVHETVTLTGVNLFTAYGISGTGQTEVNNLINHMLSTGHLLVHG